MSDNPSRMKPDSMARKTPRPMQPLRSDTDLGCIEALMEYMHLKRTYLQALKHCANKRHSADNPSCFTGSKSCKKWIMAWLERNRDFKITLVYPHRSPKLARVDVEFAT
jgi:hypothetical protein